MTLAACGSGDKSTTVESTVTDTPAISATNPDRKNMHGVRYCEILLLSSKDDGIHAEVFNTYPLNECPDDQWKAIDTAAITKPKVLSRLYQTDPAIGPWTQSRSQT